MDSELSGYDALIRPAQDQMLRSIWRITRVAEDAEDALQESLALIWRRLARIRRHPHPQALILRICVDCACDVVRARSRRGSREQALTDPDTLYSKDPAAEQRLDNLELRNEISQTLKRLPKRQATAVLMRYIAGLSYQEIGNALGCSETTARVHVNRACKRLRSLLAHLAFSQSREGER